MNVYGKPLHICNCNNKMTGWKRDGYCTYDREDPGTHIVCAKMTKEFLEFTYEMGNDLITPRGSFNGLVPGDCWCLCVVRWIEAYKQGVAPPIYLHASDQNVLRYVDMKILKKYAL